MTTSVSVQGKVINTVGNLPLADVKVFARKDGTVIQQQTDSEGKFIIYLAPDVWKITVKARGFNEPDAYRSNFTTDTTGIDFKLKEGYAISGQVFQLENGDAATGVVVTAITESNGNQEIRQVLTDQYGKFNFTGLQKGKWSLQGALNGNQTGCEVREVPPDQLIVNLIITRNMTSDDWKWGKIFFGALIALLVILTAAYLITHNLITTGAEPELTAFSDFVEQTRLIAVGLSEKKSIPDADRQLLRSTIAKIKVDWDSFSDSLLSITNGQKARINLLISQSEAAGAADQFDEAASALAGLKSALDVPNSIYFWYQPPTTYLEVLFWSLAGITVSLLITCGYYLRMKRFYIEGIWMHLSHLLSVPVLALVVVFLLSQVKLTIQIDQSAISWNIRDPRLLAALSFIIAVRPWAMLDLVKDAAQSFFSQALNQMGRNQGNQSQPGNI